MRARLIAVALPVLLLAGCASAPQPEQYLGMTGEQALASVPQNTTVVQYNLAADAGLGSNVKPVVVQSQWRVIAACQAKRQLVFGMVLKSLYTDGVVTKAKHGVYNRLPQMHYACAH